MRSSAAAPAGLLLVALLGGCSSPGPAEPASSPAAATSTAASPSPPPDLGPDDPELDVAESEPREDSYYPARGDPGVDSLHYQLDLSWDPDDRTLTGTAELLFRATGDADHFQLDLLDALEVRSVQVYGARASYTHRHDHLVVDAPVSADRRYDVVIRYAGTPAPVHAPSTRTDMEDIGMHVTAGGELWTMQEPFGAFTWYPVNDQPSDKALYDLTVRVPEEWIGVANGRLTSRSVVDGKTVTTWHLDQPASSYLITLAVGDYQPTVATSADGVPLTYWTERGDRPSRTAVRRSKAALDWLVGRLGPYPFDTLGAVVVPSESAMETQTLITLGDTEYSLSPEVLVHEYTHQWWGDLVSPDDWRDVWMNEGMTMFVQGAWEAEQEGISIDQRLHEWALTERTTRRAAGPPGDYKRGRFGDGNIYYGPALMWNELRHRVGDQAFWAVVRGWPAYAADRSVSREQLYAWIEKQTGEELSAFFDAWIMGRRTPRQQAP